jgi:nucleoside-triphosphatase THEP1
MVKSLRLKYPKTLITGLPGVGKTTLILKVIEQIAPMQIAGFYTSEVKIRGRRVGFELRGLEGQCRILAHTTFDGPYRVWKYGVDTKGFDEFLLRLDMCASNARLIVIDEIGKMELFSHQFRGLIRHILKTDKKLLATVSFKGGGLIEEIKQRSDVNIFEVTRQNRDDLTNTILQTS